MTLKEKIERNVKRREIAYELRLDGLSWKDVGVKIGCSQQYTYMLALQYFYKVKKKQGADPRLVNIKPINVDQ